MSQQQEGSKVEDIEEAAPAAAAAGMMDPTATTPNPAASAGAFGEDIRSKEPSVLRGSEEVPQYDQNASGHGGEDSVSEEECAREFQFLQDETSASLGFMLGGWPLSGWGGKSLDSSTLTWAMLALAFSMACIAFGSETGAEATSACDDDDIPYVDGDDDVQAMECSSWASSTLFFCAAGVVALSTAYFTLVNSAKLCLATSFATLVLFELGEVANAAAESKAPCEADDDYDDSFQSECNGYASAAFFYSCAAAAALVGIVLAAIKTRMPFVGTAFFAVVMLHTAGLLAAAAGQADAECDRKNIDALQGTDLSNVYSRLCDGYRGRAAMFALALPVGPVMAFFLFWLRDLRIKGRTVWIGLFLIMGCVAGGWGVGFGGKAKNACNDDDTIGAATDDDELCAGYNSATAFGSLAFVLGVVVACILGYDLFVLYNSRSGAAAGSDALSTEAGNETPSNASASVRKDTVIPQWMKRTLFIFCFVFGAAALLAVTGAFSHKCNDWDDAFDDDICPGTTSAAVFAGLLCLVGVFALGSEVGTNMGLITCSDDDDDHMGSHNVAAGNRSTGRRALDASLLNPDEPGSSASVASAPQDDGGSINAPGPVSEPEPQSAVTDAQPEAQPQQTTDEN